MARGCVTGHVKSTLCATVATHDCLCLFVLVDVFGCVGCSPVKCMRRTTAKMLEVNCVRSGSGCER